MRLANKVIRGITTDCVIKSLYTLMLISEFYMSYIDIGPYPPRNYLAVLLFITTALKVKIDTIALPRYAKISLALVPLLYLPTFAYTALTQESIDSLFFIKPFLKFFPLACSSIFLGSLYGLSFTYKTFLYTIFPNLIVAIMQGYNIDLFWQARIMLSEKDIVKLLSRPPGLSYYYIALSEQVLIAFFIVIHRLFKSEKKRDFLVFLTVCLAMYQNFTRSVIVSCFIVFIALAVKHRSEFKRSLIILSILISSYLVTVELKRYLISHGFNIQFNFKDMNKYTGMRSQFDVMDNSIGARIYISYASIKLFKDVLPFGLGQSYHQFNSIVQKYIPDWDFPGKQDAHTIAPHNFLINMTIKYGLFGFISVFSFIWLYITGALKQSHHYFYLITFFAFLANSFLHNAGFFNQPIFTIFFFTHLGHFHKGREHE